MEDEIRARVELHLHRERVYRLTAKRDATSSGKTKKKPGTAIQFPVKQMTMLSHRMNRSEEALSKAGLKSYTTIEILRSVTCLFFRFTLSQFPVSPKSGLKQQINLIEQVHHTTSASIVLILLDDLKINKTHSDYQSANYSNVILLLYPKLARL